MRLLDRYLLRELLVPLGYCLGGFLIFWIAFDLSTNLGRYQDKRLQFQDVVQLYVIKLPEILVMILPIVLLLALLYTLTNLARHHELTAIRAAGVSLARICAPYFAVGLLLSLALFFMNEHWVPDSLDREEAILRGSDPKNGGAKNPNEVDQLFIFLNSRDGHTWSFHHYNLASHIMVGPQVRWTSPAGDEMQLLADRAEYLNGVWTFFGARELGGKPGEIPVPIALATNTVAMPQFSETPDQIRREISFARRSSRVAGTHRVPHRRDPGLFESAPP